MSAFTVLIPERGFAFHELETVLQAHTTFIYKLTEKHRRRIKLCLLSDGSMENSPGSLANGISPHEMNNCFRADLTQIDPSVDQVLILPAGGNPDQVVQAALQRGVPMLGFDGPGLRKWLDNSCSMLLPYGSRNRNTERIATTLEQLYFDREALKMLRLGIRLRHEKLSRWAAKPLRFTKVA